MKTKGLIFDFGFTLFEFKDVSLEKYLDCYKQGLVKSLDKLKDFNLIRNESQRLEIMKTFNEKRMEFFKNSLKTKSEFSTTFIFKETLESYEIKNLENRFLNDLADLYHSCEEEQWVPFNHTKKTLEKLKKYKDLKLAVLSNHPHHTTIENLLNKYDLRKFFDAVVTSAKFGKRKPDPSVIFYTIRKMGLNVPESCIICGDEYADITGGNRAGLKSILCKRLFKFPFEKEIGNQEYIKIGNISEIFDYIE